MATMFMGSTQISPAKSAQQITAVLQKLGVQQILTEFGDAGEITGLTFSVLVNDQVWPYRLPIRVEAVFAVINGRRQRSRTKMINTDRKQAERTAWRQLFRWVEAQVAIIATGMVQVDEVFLPYLRARGGQTFFESLSVDNYQKALPLLKD